MTDRTLDEAMGMDIAADLRERVDGLATALAKCPPHDQVTEAIRAALERFPKAAESLAKTVWAHQFEMHGQQAKLDDITLFVQLWAVGR